MREESIDLVAIGEVARHRRHDEARDQRDGQEDLQRHGVGWPVGLGERAVTLSDVATFAPMPTTKPAAAATLVPKRMPTQISSDEDQIRQECRAVRAEVGERQRRQPHDQHRERDHLADACAAPTRVVYVTSNGTTTSMPRPSATIHSTHASVHGRAVPDHAADTADRTADHRRTDHGDHEEDQEQPAAGDPARRLRKRAASSAAIAGSTQLPSNHHDAGSTGAKSSATPNTVGTMVPARPIPIVGPATRASPPARRRQVARTRLRSPRDCPSRTPPTRTPGTVLRPPGRWSVRSSPPTVPPTAVCRSMNGLARSGSPAMPRAARPLCPPTHGIGGVTVSGVRGGQSAWTIPTGRQSTALARRRQASRGRAAASDSRTWMHTWSAPASWCSPIRAAIVSMSPHGITPSTSRSLPPSRRSSSSKP